MALCFILEFIKFSVTHVRERLHVCTYSPNSKVTAKGRLPTDTWHGRQEGAEAPGAAGAEQPGTVASEPLARKRGSAKGRLWLPQQ